MVLQSPDSRTTALPARPPQPAPIQAATAPAVIIPAHPDEAPTWFGRFVEPVTAESSSSLLSAARGADPRLPGDLEVDAFLLSKLRATGPPPATNEALLIELSS